MLARIIITMKKPMTNGLSADPYTLRFAVRLCYEDEVGADIAGYSGRNEPPRLGCLTSVRFQTLLSYSFP